MPIQIMFLVRILESENEIHLFASRSLIVITKRNPLTLVRTLIHKLCRIFQCTLIPSFYLTSESLFLQRLFLSVAGDYKLTVGVDCLLSRFKIFLKILR